MLFQSLSQPISLFIFLLLGLTCGFLIKIKTIIYKKCIKNNFLRIFFDFFIYFLIFYAFFSINLKINFGEIRIANIFVFFISFLLTQFFINKIVAKAISKCYNRRKERNNERSKT